MTDLQQTIEAAWTDRSLLQKPETQQAIREVLALLDDGKIRVAQPVDEGTEGAKNGWLTNE